MIKIFLLLVIFFLKSEKLFCCKDGSSDNQCEECGVSFQPANVRIVGGTEAIPNSWPSIAVIIFNYTFDFSYMGRSEKKSVFSTCGGTLIDRRRIITAAHCFIRDASFTFNGTNIPIIVKPNIYHPTYSSMYTAYLGLHNISLVFNKQPIYPAVAVPLRKFNLHPKFDSNSLQNDIAIIELMNEIVLNEIIQVACLPDANFELKINTPAWVAGWGSLKSGGSYSSALQNVKITIYNASYCHRIFSKKNWTTQICAGEYKGGKDTCQGDSGGPLIIKQIKNEVERSILVGITSYGLSCGMPRYPAIYTKVSAYLSWINSSRSNEQDISTNDKPNEIPTLPDVNCSKVACSKCGLRFANPNFRIYGGVEANPYSWPSIVLIVFNYKFNVRQNQRLVQIAKQFTCSGSLIDNQTILTAAHCFIREIKTFEADASSQVIPVRPNKFYPTMQSMYTVYLGVHDKKSVLEGKIQPPVLKLNIKSFRIHPNFNSSTFLNDIGIIKLREQVKLNQYIQPACLPKLPSYPKRFNRSSWAVGWGSMSDSSVETNRLQIVRMILYENNACINVYPDVKKNWNRQLCSGYLKGGKDTCDGDSGGPLFLREKVNGEFKYLLAGITSYGEGCALPGKAGIYTKVSSYLRWIRNFLKGTHNRMLKFNNRKNSKKCEYGKVGKYCDICGRHYARPNVRIIGGKKARPHSWPSTVLVRFKYSFEYIHLDQTKSTTKTGFCSGNLIDRRTVLTVAHCFFKNFSFEIDGVQHQIEVKPNIFHPTYESMYTIYLGLETNTGIYDNKTSIKPGIAVSVDKFILHENYTSDQIDFDIAIIKLKREVKFNRYVQPACLPDPKKKNFPHEVNIPVWAAGWGSISINGIIPNALHNVKMTLYDSSKCYGVIGPDETDWEKLLCAGEYMGGKDTCLGDSGGPLFVRGKVNKMNKYILVGLTSSGIGCGLAKFPGIYTKISSFLSWIELFAEK